jgi:hypothetical protein
MEVKDSFFFKDGSTVFVGPIRTEAKFIGPCECEILQTNEVRASLNIDGEMVPCASEKKSMHRSISTRQRIDLDAIGVGRTGFVIHSKA